MEAGQPQKLAFKGLLLTTVFDGVSDVERRVYKARRWLGRGVARST
jgi:hypothetical protein